MHGVVPGTPRVRREAGSRGTPLASGPPADWEISPMRSQLRSYRSASWTSPQIDASTSREHLEIPMSGVSRPPTSAKKRKKKKKKHSRRDRDHGSWSAGSCAELQVDRHGYPVIVRRTRSLISESAVSHRVLESASLSDADSDGSTDDSMRSMRSLWSLENRTKNHSRRGGDSSRSEKYFDEANCPETPRQRGSWSAEKASYDFQRETPSLHVSWGAEEAPKSYRADRPGSFERRFPMAFPRSDTEDTDNSLRRNRQRSTPSSSRRNGQCQESFHSGSTSQVQNRSARRQDDHKRRYLEEVKKNSSIAVGDRPLTDLDFALEMDKAAEESKRINKEQQTSVLQKQVDYVQLRKLVGAYANDPQQADHESLNKLLEAIGDDTTEPTTSMNSSVSSFRSLSTHQSIRSGTSSSRKEVDYTGTNFDDSERRVFQRGQLSSPAIILDEKEVYNALDLAESSQSLSQSKNESTKDGMGGLKREILGAVGHEGFVSVPLRSAMPRKSAQPTPVESPRRSGTRAQTHSESRTSPYRGRNPVIKNHNSPHHVSSFAAHRLLRALQEESIETGHASSPDSENGPALSTSQDDNKHRVEGYKSEVIEACGHEGLVTMPLGSAMPRRGPPTAPVDSQRELPYQGRRQVANIGGSSRRTSSAADHRLLKAIQEGSLEPCDALPPDNKRTVSVASSGRNVHHTGESSDRHGSPLSERGHHLSLPKIGRNEIDNTYTSTVIHGSRESDRGHLPSPKIMINEKEAYETLHLAEGSQTSPQSMDDSREDAMEGHKREILEAFGHEEFVTVPLRSAMPRRTAPPPIQSNASTDQGHQPVVNNQGGSHQASSIVAHRILRLMQDESISDDEHSCPDNKASDTGESERQRRSKEANSNLVPTPIAIDEKKIDKVPEQAECDSVISMSKGDSKTNKLKREVLHFCGEEVGVEGFESVPLKSAMPRAPPPDQSVVEDVESDRQNASQLESSATRAPGPASKPAQGALVQGNNKSRQVPGKSDQPRKRFSLFNHLGMKCRKGRKEKSTN